MEPFGGFSPEALEAYQKAVSEKEGLDFSEGETYDFTRCMRSDGSVYGTRGKCKKGKEAGDKEPETPRTAGGKKRRATAEAKKEAKAASRAAAGAKVSAGAARTRLLKEELEKVRDKMKGASPEEQNRLIQEASKKASERAAAGEDAGRRSSTAAQENKDARREARTRQVDRAALARQIAKETGKSVTDAAVQNEAVRRLDAKRGAPANEGKPAGKPRASASELKASQEKLFDEAKAKRAAAREAEKEAKRVAKETKGDTSPEAKKKRLEAGRAWDKASTAADSAQRKWMKEHERWSKASGREERAKMSPEQRAEQRRIDKIIKEQG